MSEEYKPASPTNVRLLSLSPYFDYTTAVKENHKLKVKKCSVSKESDESHHC